MTLLIFLLILSVLILVHEFGHFVAAKKAGIRVEEFGLGFPPRLWVRKIGETTYSINLLLFGGYVRLYGEERPEEDKLHSFFDKPKAVRAVVILAGVLMNFLLSVLAFAIIYSVLGVPRKVDFVKIVAISQDSPAQEAGLEVEDIISSVDGIAVSSSKQFVQLIEQKKGEKIVLEVKRKDVKSQISVAPRKEPPQGEGPLGVAITDTQIYYPPAWQRPFFGVYFGAKEAVFWAKTTAQAAGKILTELLTTGVLPRDLAGPVGIFQITGGVAESGPLALINFLGILSVNLAILNIFPFPALDGGRLLFIGIETVFGRRVLPRVERVAHAIGMAILLLLLLAITIQDVGRLISSDSFSSLIKKVSP